jgi:transcriptional regulator with XRE-family HTH domain
MSKEKFACPVCQKTFPKVLSMYAHKGRCQETYRGIPYFSIALRIFMDKRRWNQRTLATALDISEGTVSHWMNHGRKPKNSTYIKLCKLDSDVFPLPMTKKGPWIKPNSQSWEPTYSWEDDIRDQLSREVANAGFNMSQLMSRQQASNWAGGGSLPTIRSLVKSLAVLGVKPSKFFSRIGM